MVTSCSRTFPASAGPPQRGRWRGRPADFRRIQFTSDLLPSDVIGVSVWNESRGSSISSFGPLFANVVLADEINRAAPRTQSNLLEAMSEGRVSVDHYTYTIEQ